MDATNAIDARLSLHNSVMSDEDIQELTVALRRSLQQETDLNARLPEETGGSGTKGDPITIGQIFLAALSSGTVVALLQVLKSYVERKPTLRFEIEKADGSKMKIEAEHLSVAQIEQTTLTIKQLLHERDA
jgi:hypothetical protein